MQIKIIRKKLENLKKMQDINYFQGWFQVYHLKNIIKINKINKLYNQNSNLNNSSKNNNKLYRNQVIKLL